MEQAHKFLKHTQVQQGTQHTLAGSEEVTFLLQPEGGNRWAGKRGPCGWRQSGGFVARGHFSFCATCPRKAELYLFFFLRFYYFFFGGGERERNTDARKKHMITCPLNTP